MAAWSLLTCVCLKIHWRCSVGPLPSGIRHMTLLVDIVLTNQRLSGCIPTEIGALTNLTRLVLGGNSLTGEHSLVLLVLVLAHVYADPVVAACVCVKA